MCVGCNVGEPTSRIRTHTAGAPHDQGGRGGLDNHYQPQGFDRALPALTPGILQDSFQKSFQLFPARICPPFQAGIPRCFQPPEPRSGKQLFKGSWPNGTPERNLERTLERIFRGIFAKARCDIIISPSKPFQSSFQRSFLKSFMIRSWKSLPGTRLPGTGLPGAPLPGPPLPGPRLKEPQFLDPHIQG